MPERSLRSKPVSSSGGFRNMLSRTSRSRSSSSSSRTSSNANTSQYTSTNTTNTSYYSTSSSSNTNSTSVSSSRTDSQQSSHSHNSPRANSTSIAAELRRKRLLATNSSLSPPSSSPHSRQGGAASHALRTPKKANVSTRRSVSVDKDVHRNSAKTTRRSASVGSVRTSTSPPGAETGAKSPRMTRSSVLREMAIAKAHPTNTFNTGHLNPSRSSAVAVSARGKVRVRRQRMEAVVEEEEYSRKSGTPTQHFHSSSPNVNVKGGGIGSADADAGTSISILKSPPSQSQLIHQLEELRKQQKDLERRRLDGGKHVGESEGEGGAPEWRASFDASFDDFMSGLDKVDANVNSNVDADANADPNIPTPTDANDSAPRQNDPPQSQTKTNDKQHNDKTKHNQNPNKTQPNPQSNHNPTQTHNLSIPNLHIDLANCAWENFHKHILALSLLPNENPTHKSSTILQTISKLHPEDGGTVLHTAVWKAPPPLTLMLLRLLPPPSADLPPSLHEEYTRCFSTRDRDGNTPLHLCCANLSFSTFGNTRVLDGSVLEALVQYAPQALLLSNHQGDTPVHLFVTSSAATFHHQQEGEETETLSTPPRANTARPPHLELETVFSHLLGACPEQRKQVGMARDHSGATPLHAAIASSSHFVLIRSLLELSPESCRVSDEGGRIPLHYVGAFCNVEERVVRLLLEGFAKGSKVNGAGAGAGAGGVGVGIGGGGICCQTENGDTPLHLAVSNWKNRLDAGGEEGEKLDKNTVQILELLMGHGMESGGGGGGGADDAGGVGTLPERDAAGFPLSTIGYDAFVHGGNGGAGLDGMSSGGLSFDLGLDSRNCPILITNREKSTPLHCCALFDAPPQLTRILMKHPLSKRAASMTNSFGATPLHLAAAQPSVGTSIATVTALGTSEAAAVQDRLKRTPLHVASQNIYATSQLIKSLVELNPDATREKTQRGHLPLHLAAQSQAKEAVVKALIKAYPDGTQAKNKSFNTPLHDAAKYRASAGVVSLLLEKYPEAVFIQNQYGNLPLHCATAYQAPSDVVELLLKAWPDGASMQNRNEDCPLHYAAAYATSADAVKPLITAAPAAVLLLNSSGQSPVDRAKANNASSDIVKLLENSAEEWTTKASNDGFGSFNTVADFEVPALS